MVSPQKSLESAFRPDSDLNHGLLGIRDWIWLLAPFLILVVFVPLVAAHNKFEMDNPIFRPHALSAIQSIRFLLEPAAAAFGCSLAVMIAVHTFRNTATPTNDPTPAPMFPSHELVAVVGFLLVPFFAAATAYFVTRVFMDRYGLLAIIGVTGLFGMFHRQYAGLRTLAAAAVLMGSYLGGFVPWPSGSRLSKDLDGAPASLDRISPSLPFVVGTGIWFLPLDYYADDGFAKRLVYLRDKELAVKYTGSDVFEVGYPILKRWTPLRGSIEDYSTFVQTHPRFMLYTSKGFALDWQMRKLVDDGADLRLLAMRDEGLVFEVIAPPSREVAPSAASPSTPP